MKHVLLFAALLALTACGFRPVHGRDYRAEQEADLSALRVMVDNTRYGQLLKAEIERGINPDYERAEKLYKVRINLTEREIYLFVNPDGTSSRADIEYRSTYSVTRVLDGKELAKGALNRTSSYNISESADYATFVSQGDARKRGIVELAEDYKLRLSNLLPRLNPKEQP